VLLLVCPLAGWPVDGVAWPGGGVAVPCPGALGPACPAALALVPAATLRLRPVARSKTCRDRASAHNSALSPSLKAS